MMKLLRPYTSRANYLILTLLISIITLSVSAQKGDTTTVVIIHINDIHAKINNFPRLASLKSELESRYENVFLVSAGDIFSGNPIVDQYKEKGYPIIDLMNKTSFDLSTLGNHEFDYGQEILSQRMHQAEFDIICANLKVDNNAFPQPKPYKIFETKNLLFQNPFRFLLTSHQI